ncbi:hypothetical protein BCV70DRAFT_76349 [Testicularia cyperi]|uniref:Uncharacterized protein n=1 Tax=Testicularia cyperi TaxID=1882483 RepID=A0A317XUK6_9BASI|nr:hypothetical protein BCV70DRAFT_76349 [Testicularia cyperi]
MRNPRPQLQPQPLSLLFSLHLLRSLYMQNLRLGLHIIPFPAFMLARSESTDIAFLFFNLRLRRRNVSPMDPVECALRPGLFSIVLSKKPDHRPRSTKPRLPARLYSGKFFRRAQK